MVSIADRDFEKVFLNVYENIADPADLLCCNCSTSGERGNTNASDSEPGKDKITSH